MLIPLPKFRLTPCSKVVSQNQSCISPPLGVVIPNTIRITAQIGMLYRTLSSYLLEVSRQARDVAFSTQTLLISTRLAMASRPRKLLDQVRDTIRLKHYSYRTEQSYVAWIRRYSLFHICMKVGYRKR
ncbi:phage integrase N-terminal SAM-like domain-containing protein [Thermocoleostomius sinensis]|uniref:phage integrase N-terminal SAM-like domain-containing protein n=1 Tax=Thermocoleostomius sinensis TaxID=3065396 RepID=UPI0036F1C62D